MTRPSATYRRVVEAQLLLEKLFIASTTTGQDGRLARIIDKAILRWRRRVRAQEVRRG